MVMVSKTICLTVAWVVCCVLIVSCKDNPPHSVNNEKKGYQEEIFSFPINCGKETLTGTLTIPKGFDSPGKAIILVTPPGACSRNYNGLYSNLAKELSRNGIAVLRYDPRHVADTTLSSQSVTMLDQANDAESAYAALKKDKRFGPIIGLLGHSEGGNSVAIVAARNKNISFVVLLSTLGVSGVEFQLQNVRNKLEKMAAFVHLAQGKAPDSPQNELIYSQVKNIFSIIANNRNTDSIYELIKKQNEYFYEKYYKQYPGMFGTVPIEVHNKRDSTRLLTPHSMTLIQFQPELYYSKISCPVLAIFGKMDEKVFWEENSKRMESLFKKSQKKNYKIVVIDSIDHEYRKVTDSLSRLIPPGIVHHSKKSIAQKNDNFYVPVFSLIAKWVNKRK